MLLELQESLPHELRGGKVVRRPGLASVECRSAQRADIRQHALTGNLTQCLRERRGRPARLCGDALAGP
jgi:hypothetical protein